MLGRINPDKLSCELGRIHIIHRLKISPAGLCSVGYITVISQYTCIISYVRSYEYKQYKSLDVCKLMVQFWISTDIMYSYV